MTDIMYQLPVPRYDNKGRGLGAARKRFLTSVASIAGGYTLHPDARGVWVDHGRVYRDVMTPLSFATTPRDARRIVAAFHHAFPDQVATMLTTVGKVELVRW